MITKRTFFFCTLFLCSVGIGHASAEPLHVSGYVKSFLTRSSTNATQRGEFNWDNALRARVSKKVNKETLAEAAYELLPLIRRREALSITEAIGPRPFAYRITDLDLELVRTSADFFLLQNLDRLNLSYRAPTYDFTLGRQPISFGAARAINPTDIIAPFTFGTLDQEERVGVDAARITIPTGELSDVEGGFIAGEQLNINESVLFLKGRHNIAETDFTATAIYFRRNFLVGFDLQRGIGELGFWVEGAHTFARGRRDTVRAKNYSRLSSGVDYRFENELYLAVEYHYNSPGIARRRNDLENINQTAYVDGSVYLLGNHYIAPSASYPVTPLLNLSIQLLLNVQDPSLYSYSLVEYSIKQDLYFDCGLLYSVGSNGSEFGQRQDLFFFSLRKYF